MNFRMLKKDLKRKKSINIILLIFIALATTFIASSINNMSVILNSTEDFFRIAKLSDHIIITMSGTKEESHNDKEIREFLENQKNVTSYYIDETIWLGDNNIEIVGHEDFSIINTTMLSKFNINQQKFFDKDNKEITTIEDGTIYISQKVMESEGIEINDTVYITDDLGYSKKFTVAGSFKDAFLGSALMGTDRFLVNEKDYQDVLDNANIPYMYGTVYSIWTDDIDAYEKEYYEQGFSTMFFCNKEMIKSTYILDIVTAAIILLVSVCLVAVSVLMLRFTISFTIGEDYKEIGILKAIGLKDNSIRMLYTFKYMIISIVGAIIGGIASVPFGKLMIEQAMKSMVIPETSNNIIVNLGFSILVAVIVVFFAYLSTKRIKKMTPMDAIRSGHTGERFSKKSLLKLNGTRNNTNMFMAINDILCDFKKYIILFITSIIGIWLVIMPVNTINTLSSENIIPWFGMLKSDYYIINHEQARMNEIIGAGDKNMYIEFLQEINDDLSNEGIDIERVFSEAVFRMKIRFGETSYQSIALQGINTKTNEYEYLEGTAPVRDNEVAITHVISDIIGAKIGDTVYITVTDKEVPFVVTAIYQSMNNLGEGIRFTENCKIDYSRLAGTLGIQVDLTNSSSKNVEQAIEKSREVYKDSQIDGAVAFLDSMLGGTASIVGDVKLVVLIVVIVINVLVVILMQKIFITKEKGQIAMLKAIGFSKRAIYSWQLRRIGLVVINGTLIGILTSELFTSLTSGLVFKYMGCKTIEFSINVLEVYITYPLLVISITLIGCCLSITKIKKINVQEVNDME